MVKKSGPNESARMRLPAATNRVLSRTKAQNTAAREARAKRTQEIKAGAKRRAVPANSSSMTAGAKKLVKAESDRIAANKKAAAAKDGPFLKVIKRLNKRDRRKT